MTGSCAPHLASRDGAGIEHARRHDHAGPERDLRVRPRALDERARHVGVADGRVRRRHETVGDAVLADRRGGDQQAAGPDVRQERPAGPEADDRLRATLGELLERDRRTGAADAVRRDRERHAPPRALERVVLAEPADLACVVEPLREVLRAVRVADDEDVRRDRADRDDETTAGSAARWT